MKLPLADRIDTPIFRASAFYFTLFMAPAVANPYLSIWLTGRGFTAPEIGTISAAPIFVMIVLNMVVGRIADRAKDWRSVIIFGSILGGLAPLTLFFLDGFWGVLVAWTLVIVPFQAISPVADAATVRMTRRLNKDFGMVRVWGTLGFVIATSIAGVMLDWRGVGIFVPAVVTVTLIRALMSLQLPYFRSVEPPLEDGEVRLGDEPKYNPLVATRVREIWRPWFFLALVGGAFIHASHMLQMSFGALLWQEQGIPTSIIGPLWALGGVSEIVVMLFFGKIAKRFSARHLLLAAAVTGALRWTGFALNPPLWAYVPLQFLHMGSFGLSYMGMVSFIANWTSDEIAAQAQSFFIVMRQIGMVLALSGFGFVVALMGLQSFLFAALLSATGGVVILVSLAIMSPKAEQATA